MGTSVGPGWRAFVAGGILAGAVLGTAASVGASGSHPGGVPQTCPEILSGPPTGGVEKETSPPEGSVVVAGDVVEVTLRWAPGDFDGAELHKALDCVTVDGTLAESLSVEEKPTGNDGVFTHRYAIPEGLPAGAAVCDRGFVSGPGSGGGFDREKSNDVCFEVGGGSQTQPGRDLPPGTVPPESRPPDSAVPGEPVPPVPDSAPPGSQLPGSQLPGSQPPTGSQPATGDVPTGDVLPGRLDTARPPADATSTVDGRNPGPGVDLRGEQLPRTGGGSRLPVLVAGVALALGGLGVAAAPRVRRPVP